LIASGVPTTSLTLLGLYFSVQGLLSGCKVSAPTL
jgi:hypothetical protein